MNASMSNNMGMSGMGISSTLANVGAMSGMALGMSDIGNRQGLNMSPQYMSQIAALGMQTGQFRGIDNTNAFGARLAGYTSAIMGMSQLAGTNAQESAQQIAQIQGAFGGTAMGAVGTSYNMASAQHLTGQSISGQMGAASLGAQTFSSMGLGRSQGASFGLGLSQRIGYASQHGGISHSKLEDLGGVENISSRLTNGALRSFGSTEGSRILAAMMNDEGQLDEQVASQVATGSITRQQLNARASKVLMNRRRSGMLSANREELMGSFMSEYGPEGMMHGIEQMTSNTSDSYSRQKQIMGLGNSEMDIMKQLSGNGNDIRAKLSMSAREGIQQSSLGRLSIKEAIGLATDRMLAPIKEGMHSLGRDIGQSVAESIDEITRDLAGQSQQGFSGGGGITSKYAALSNLGMSGTANQLFGKTMHGAAPGFQLGAQRSTTAIGKFADAVTPDAIRHLQNRGSLSDLPAYGLGNMGWGGHAIAADAGIGALAEFAAYGNPGTNAVAGRGLFGALGQGANQWGNSIHAGMEASADIRNAEILRGIPQGPWAKGADGQFLFKNGGQLARAAEGELGFSGFMGLGGRSAGSAAKTTAAWGLRGLGRAAQFAGEVASVAALPMMLGDVVSSIPDYMRMGGAIGAKDGLGGDEANAYKYLHEHGAVKMTMATMHEGFLGARGSDAVMRSQGAVPVPGVTEGAGDIGVDAWNFYFGKTSGTRKNFTGPDNTTGYGHGGVGQSGGTHFGSAGYSPELKQAWVEQETQRKARAFITAGIYDTGGLANMAKMDTDSFRDLSKGVLEEFRSEMDTAFMGRALPATGKEYAAMESQKLMGIIRKRNGSLATGISGINSDGAHGEEMEQALLTVRQTGGEDIASKLRGGLVGGYKSGMSEHDVKGLLKDNLKASNEAMVKEFSSNNLRTVPASKTPVTAMEKFYAFMNGSVSMPGAAKRLSGAEVENIRQSNKYGGESGDLITGAAETYLAGISSEERASIVSAPSGKQAEIARAAIAKMAKSTVTDSAQLAAIGQMMAQPSTNKMIAQYAGVSMNFENDEARRRDYKVATTGAEAYNRFKGVTGRGIKEHLDDLGFDGASRIGTIAQNLMELEANPSGTPDYYAARGRLLEQFANEHGKLDSKQQQEVSGIIREMGTSSGSQQMNELFAKGASTTAFQQRLTGAVKHPKLIGSKITEYKEIFGDSTMVRRQLGEVGSQQRKYVERTLKVTGDLPKEVRAGIINSYVDDLAPSLGKDGAHAVGHVEGEALMDKVGHGITKKDLNSPEMIRAAQIRASAPVGSGANAPNGNGKFNAEVETFAAKLSEASKAVWNFQQQIEGQSKNPADPENGHKGKKND